MSTNVSFRLLGGNSFINENESAPLSKYGNDTSNEARNQGKCLMAGKVRNKQTHKSTQTHTHTYTGRQAI